MLGQPAHCFDADKNKRWRSDCEIMPEGTPFVTLDGVERKLNERDLMICNKEDAMCIAGVFGGLDSVLQRPQRMCLSKVLIFIRHGYVRLPVAMV